MALTKYWKGKEIKITDEIIYILVQRLNVGNEDEIDKDVILSIYKTEDSAIIAKEIAEERAREYGFDDVFAVKGWHVWE